MANTPRHALPLMSSATEQNWSVYSNAMKNLDAIVNTAVQAIQSAPPGSPAEGQAYIVQATGTGAWAGHDNDIAFYINAGWTFFDSISGWTVFNVATGTFYFWNGSAWVLVATGTGGVEDFVDLGDVPASYAGHGGKSVFVKGDETGLEFDTGIENFTDLGDVPTDYTGDALKLVRVNAGETALEFYTPQVELALFAAGVPDNAEVLLSYTPTKSFQLPSGLTGSVSKAEVAATGSTVFDIKKNGSNVGSITFSAAGTTGTLAMASATTFTAATDKLTVVGPSTADATLADLSVSLIGNLV